MLKKKDSGQAGMTSNVCCSTFYETIRIDAAGKNYLLTPFARKAFLLWEKGVRREKGVEMPKTAAAHEGAV